MSCTGHANTTTTNNNNNINDVELYKLFFLSSFINEINNNIGLQNLSL